MSGFRPRNALIRRLLAGAVAIAVSATLVGPPPAAAESVSKVREQMRALEDDMRDAGREYDKAYWRFDEALVAKQRTAKKLGKTKTELARAREMLGTRVDAMYRNQGGGMVAVLLAAEDFSDLITRLQFFQRIGTADADAIQRVKDLQAELRAQKRELAEEVRAREKTARELQKKRDELQARFRDKQSEYKQLQARLAAASRARSTGMSSYAPAGPNGMVFPVRGANYYSDTWGASRSGGRRRHQGTDIMAASGTPCVAVLAGSVSARSSGLGGLTIWLTADNGWQFYYAHLSGYAVTSGRVSAGQTIGYVGATGNARGGSPHLHFEIHPGGGAAVNPYPYLRAMQ